MCWNWPRKLNFKKQFHFKSYLFVIFDNYKFQHKFFCQAKFILPFLPWLNAKYISKSTAILSKTQNQPLQAFVLFECLETANDLEFESFRVSQASQSKSVNKKQKKSTQPWGSFSSPNLQWKGFIKPFYGSRIKHDKDFLYQLYQVFFLY